MKQNNPKPDRDTELIVFDFDHTLYNGDSGSDFFYWLLQKNLWRKLVALLVTPLVAPFVVYLPTRRRALTLYIWIATVGLAKKNNLDGLIKTYVQQHESKIRQRLLPKALSVFEQHRRKGDQVIVATGAPAQLAHEILTLVKQTDLPIFGSELIPGCGAMRLSRHCHHEEKMRILREHGYADIAMAYSDSTADLPLLKAARKPVVVNPKTSCEAFFRQVLPEDTPLLNWGCPKRGGTPV